jgi:hypothetical protein
MFPDGCCGHPWPGVDANGAMATPPGGGAPSAPPRGPGATLAAACRARAAGYAAAAGLEHRHTAVLLAGRQTLFARFPSAGPRPPHRAQGQRPQGEGERPAPPSHAGPRHDPGPRRPGPLHSAGHWSSRGPPPARPSRAGSLGGQDDVRWQLLELAHAPPDQPPAAPVRRQGLGHGPPAPGIPARPLRALAHTAPGPPRWGPRRQARLDWALVASQTASVPATAKPGACGGAVSHLRRQRARSRHVWPCRLA